MKFLKLFLSNKAWAQKLFILVAAAFLVNMVFKHLVDAGNVPTEETFLAKVVRVGDGDTLTIMDPQNQKIKIRLASIDAPEYKQTFGKESRAYLNQLIYDKTIKVQNLGLDPYNRVLAKIWYQNKDVQLQLIEEGMAWHYAYFAKKQQTDAEFKQYEQAQKQAKANQLGLWKDPKAISPWNFKRNERRRNKAKTNY